MKDSKKLWIMSFLLSMAFVLAVILLCYVNAKAGEVKLTWDPNSESDLAGYKVQQSTDNAMVSPTVIDLPLATLADVSAPQFNYLSLPDGTYYFTVTAYDNADNESGPSNKVSISINQDPPGNPTNLRVE